MLTNSFSPDASKALPNLKEATSMAKTTTGFGVLAFQNNHYWIVWDEFDFGLHTTPIKKWDVVKKSKRPEVKINKANEDMITSEGAKEVFNKLVMSGLVPLYVKYITIDLAGKKVPKNLSVKTLEDCERADRFFSFETDVYTFGDLNTGFMFYPEGEYLEDFGPTIAKLWE